MRRPARRTGVVFRAAMLPLGLPLNWGLRLGNTGVIAWTAIDADAVVAARTSVGGVTGRRGCFGDSGRLVDGGIWVVTIVERAAVGAATCVAFGNLHLGRPCRRQSGINLVDGFHRVLRQRNARFKVSAAPQKGIAVFWAGLGGCVRGREMRATLWQRDGRRAFALAGHAFTLERACSAGTGNARPTARRLSMKKKAWKSCLLRSSLSTQQHGAFFEPSGRAIVATARHHGCFHFCFKSSSGVRQQACQAAGLSGV